MMENTLLLLKPDAQQRGLTDDILDIVQNNDLILQVTYKIVPSEQLVLEHYGRAIKKHGDFLAQRLVDYFSSGPVVASLVIGDNAVERLRTLCGENSDPSKCPKGTIRGDYGIDTLENAMAENRGVRNLVHSPENIDDAKREVALLFDTFLPRPIYNYLYLPSRFLQE